MIKVSICIPVYNMESCIKRAIRSALAQTYCDFEVLVVDNQSTDKTYEEALSVKDPRVKVFRNSKNFGAYGNHNRCVELASGEWIKFLHGDDELIPDCVEKMIAALKNCPEDTALIGCGEIYLDPKDQESKRSFVPENLVCMKPAPPHRLISIGNIFGTPTMVMLRRQSLLDAGNFDLTLDPCADGDCWFNLRTRYSSAILPEHLVYARDDVQDEVSVRDRRGAKLYTNLMREIEKWYRKDPLSRQISFQKSPFAEALIVDCFRFWDMALYYAIQGKSKLLNAMVVELRKMNMLAPSLRFYFWNRFILWKKVTDFRDRTWLEALKDIILTNPGIPVQFQSTVSSD